MKKIFLCVAAVYLSACGEMQSSNVFQALESINGGQKVDFSVPACEVEPSEYLLDTQVSAFEITDRKNVSFGFDLATAFFRIFGFNIKTESGRMTLFMHLYESIKPNLSVASVLGEGRLKGKEFRFNLTLKEVGIGGGYYNRTPLAQLSERALRSGLSNLMRELNAQGSGWRTRTLYVDNEKGFAVVPVGSVSGVKFGDEFGLYNVEHLWSGKPCESTHIMERKTSRTPLVIAKAMMIENHASLIEFTAPPSESINVGARVEISKLEGNTAKNPRTLRYPVAIRSVKSEYLALPDGSRIDITPYARDQMAALFDQYGFNPTSLRHTQKPEAPR
jgi:hypothetical protein